MAFNKGNVPARIRCGAGGFVENARGGVAIIFAFVFPVIAFLSLVVIDYSRASAAKQALQDTLDAASLIVARSTAILPDDVDAVGDKAFGAQLPQDADIEGLAPDPQTGRIAGVTFTPSGSKVTGTASATVTPLVSQLFIGSGGMTIRASSEVTRTVNKLEIALVLDTTGSMETNDKIGKLRLAANTFIDLMATASARSTEVNPVKIAIVPFSTTVKVAAPITLHGSTAYNDTSHTMAGLPTWLDGQGRAWNDSSIPSYLTKVSFNTATRDRFTFLKQMKTPWGGCVEARRAPYDIKDTPPSTSTNPTLEETKTLFTPYFWPDDPDTQATNKNGNFGSFKNNYVTDLVYSTTDWKVPQRNDTKYNIGTGSIKSGTFSLGSGYGAAQVLGPNAGCAMQQLNRLSTDFPALKTTVNGLVASGETNIPLGLMWGWHALSPNAPFADGKPYGTAKTQKIIVLMTDGDNTMNTPSPSNNNTSHYHGYGYIWQDRLGTTSSTASTRTTKMDDRLTALCANLRNPLGVTTPDPDKKIIVYAVGVGVSANAKSKLQTCATESAYYYDVDAQAANLTATFSAIAGSIESLRLSK